MNLSYQEMVGLASAGLEAAGIGDGRARIQFGIHLIQRFHRRRGCARWRKAALGQQGRRQKAEG